jgi:predicted transcriptional regulator
MITAILYLNNFDINLTQNILKIVLKKPQTFESIIKNFSEKSVIMIDKNIKDLVKEGFIFLDKGIYKIR